MTHNIKMNWVTEADKGDTIIFNGDEECEVVKGGTLTHTYFKGTKPGKEGHVLISVNKDSADKFKAIDIVDGEVVISTKRTFNYMYKVVA